MIQQNPLFLVFILSKKKIVNKYKNNKIALLIVYSIASV